MFKKIFILLLFLLSSGFVLGCDNISLTGRDTVPDTMTYIGTKYINCHVSDDFPAQTTKQLTTLSGTVKKPLVDRKSPLLNTIVIDDNVLFNLLNDLYFNSAHSFRAAIDKKITVKGYYGDEEIEGYKKFYVTDVIGWHYVCCDATLEDTGIVNTENVCHWFEK